ncbi:hypothetical protein C8Q79DRAFT_464929 [Trametes meyenii]|nr:hypothetical protein C8Q79DRAFT_464929 [Trametes meyenii]
MPMDKPLYSPVLSLRFFDARSIRTTMAASEWASEGVPIGDIDIFHICLLQVADTVRYCGLLLRVFFLLLPRLPGWFIVFWESWLLHNSRTHSLNTYLPMCANAPPLPPATAVPLLPALDNTYGVLMVGTFIGSILYGLALHQVYRYTRSIAYKRDSTYVKCMVGSCIVRNLAFCNWDARCFLVFDHQLLQSASSVPRRLGIIIAVSQSFFARRLWLIDRKFRFLVVFVVSTGP